MKCVKMFFFCQNCSVIDGILKVYCVNMGISYGHVCVSRRYCVKMAALIKLIFHIQVSLTKHILCFRDISVSPKMRY